MSGRVLRFFAMAALALLVMQLSLPAAAQDFFGPLRIRDMGPVGFTRLHMIPDHAVPPRRGAFALELHLSHSNTFAMDKNTLDYLEMRGGRMPLSDQDIDNLFAANENTYLFDAALDVAQLTAHYGFDDNWSAYLHVPAYGYGGGNLDSLIEGFHEDFGFSNFGRPYLPRDSFTGLIGLDGRRFVLREAPESDGIGDPTVGIRRYWKLSNGNAVTLELAHKFAVQDANGFTSTGSADTAVQASWQKQMTNNAWYANFAVVSVGDAAPFPDATRKVVPSFNIAWEHRLSSGFNLLIQFNAQQSLFKDGRGSELGKNVFQASIGLRHRVDEFVWSYALTENLINFNNTADLGFHVGFAWTPGIE